VRVDVKKAPNLAVAMSDVGTFLKVADNFSKAVQQFNKEVMAAGGKVLLKEYINLARKLWLREVSYLQGGHLTRGGFSKNSRYVLRGCVSWRRRAGVSVVGKGGLYECCFRRSCPDADATSSRRQLLI
jgi:hypothetical protein